jgi:hypothetical protein
MAIGTARLLAECPEVLLHYYTTLHYYATLLYYTNIQLYGYATILLYY